MPKYNMPYCDEGSSPAGWRAPEPKLKDPMKLWYISYSTIDMEDFDLLVRAVDPQDAYRIWHKYWNLIDVDEPFPEGDGPHIFLVPSPDGERGAIPWESIPRHDPLFPSGA